MRTVSTMTGDEIITEIDAILTEVKGYLAPLNERPGLYYCDDWMIKISRQGIDVTFADPCLDSEYGILVIGEGGEMAKIAPLFSDIALEGLRAFRADCREIGRAI